MDTIKEKINDAKVGVRNFYEISRIRKAYKEVVDMPGDGSGPKVLFHTIRTIPTSPVTHLESIFYHAMRIRGARTKMLFCGSYFNDCDADHFFVDHRQYCVRCRTLRAETVEAIGVEAAWYKDYISKAEEDELRKLANSLSFEEKKTYNYLDIDVGRITVDTLIRFYQSPYLPDRPGMKEKFASTFLRALLLVQIAKNYVAKERPDILFTLHGVYAAWEPFYAYCAKNGVTSYVYIFCFGDAHGVRFVKNGREAQCVGPSIWQDVKERDLTPAERQEFEEFLRGRFAFERGWVQVINLGNEDPKSARDALAFLERPASKRFVMFTNIPWDSALIQGDTVFNSLTDWIDETLTYFIEHPEQSLLIKVHPAERLDPNSYTLSSYIKTKFSPLPENIFMLPSDTKLKPYELFSRVDAGIVYTGTIGLELAMMGTAAIVAGHTHYTEAENDVVYAIKTKADYFNALENVEKVKAFAQKNREQAYKYAYTFFQKTEVTMPFFVRHKIAVFDPQALNRIREIVCEDPSVNLVCEKILNKEEVHRPPIDELYKNYQSQNER